ncbi:unnamed protein product [Rotaria sp. Silwood2]|nr:unnamed protein product [Rotaria sp. Silwood2]CAF3208436.1 unnamed protein product [Rotaria sp. Silwood2]CAF4651680.1 unnamed protein product [Rotaria sp. Silwood2]
MPIFFGFFGTNINPLNENIKHREEIKLHPEWNRIYGPGHTYWTGALQDGLDRGPHPYYCPVGWKRYSLYVADNFREKFSGWCVCYHGTKFQYGLSILTSGLKPANAAEHGQGSYFSPSIIYACHPRYSEIKPVLPEHQNVFGKSAKYIQFVLECRVRPQNIIIGCETFHIENTTIDHNIPNNVLEWIVNTGDKIILDFADLNATVVCTGLMVRVTNNHPYFFSESQWWQKTCRCNNNFHCAWNADRDDLEKQKANGATCIVVLN